MSRRVLAEKISSCEPPNPMPHPQTLTSPYMRRSQEIYPYRVLQGLEGLRVGASVELQWKMKPGGTLMFSNVI